MHDLKISNARIYDGLGNMPVDGDVAIKSGRILAIGKDLGPARETVEADGLALMPGIIDTHTHYDAQITWDPMANPSPSLGYHDHHGQLRIHHRAVPTGRPRPGHAQSHACRGHVVGGAARGFTGTSRASPSTWICLSGAGSGRT